MKKYTVRFKIEVPDNTDIYELEEFLEFELGIMGGLSGDNPFADTDLLSQNTSNLSVDPY